MKTLVIILGIIFGLGVALIIHEIRNAIEVDPREPFLHDELI